MGNKVTLQEHQHAMESGCFFCLFLRVAVARSHDAKFVINGTCAAYDLFMLVLKAPFRAVELWRCSETRLRVCVNNVLWILKPLSFGLLQKVGKSCLYVGKTTRWKGKEGEMNVRVGASFSVVSTGRVPLLAVPARRPSPAMARAFASARAYTASSMERSACGAGAPISAVSHSRGELSVKPFRRK